MVRHFRQSELHLDASIGSPQFDCKQNVDNIDGNNQALIPVHCRQKFLEAIKGFLSRDSLPVGHGLEWCAG